jgi:hypothetical protein
LRNRWKLAVIGLPVAGALLWGLGLPGHAVPVGPGAPAAVAARTKAAELADMRAEAAATRAREAAYLAALPKRKPDYNLTFRASTLDTSIFATCYPYMNLPTGCTNFGNVQEREWYLPSQDKVSHGVLHLVARRERTQGTARDNSPKKYYCRSGMITTDPGLTFEYGFLQVVAKVPRGTGLWSGLWLGAANNQWPPEIDMIERWGSGVNTVAAAQTAAFFHPRPRSVGRSMGPIPLNLTTDWQKYSLLWTSSKMEFFVGTQKVLTVTSHVPHQQMYFLADLADYAAAGVGVVPGACNGELDIRSIKLWKL